MTTSTNRAPTQPRRPLDATILRRALADVDLAGPVELLAECTSTNDVARHWSGSGDSTPPEWVLVAAESQTVGRGRVGRRWESPPGSGLMFSLALATPSAADSAVIGVVPLAAGVAVVEVCRALGVGGVGLKWPNDVVISAAQVEGLPLKVGGILTERAVDRVIVGIGLNFDLRPAEAPTPQAASLRDHGLAAEVSREELLARIVAELVETWRGMLANGSAGVLARFTALCTTLGRQVVISTPGSQQISGEAVAIDRTGRLVIRAADGSEQHISAGDVTFVRPPDVENPAHEVRWPGR